MGSVKASHALSVGERVGARLPARGPPHSAGGSHVNFMMAEGPERIQATYRDNDAPLARVKAVYDPENRFQINQNINPAA